MIIFEPLLTKRLCFTDTRTRTKMAAVILLLLSSPIIGQQKITVNPGDDVTLQCLDPRGGNIKLLEWTRSDLKEQGFVFYFRDKPLNDEFQLSTFHGRVELKDPQMKNGDASVILKNVTVNDTGTYECRAANGGRPQLISNITLIVTDSGGGAGHTEDRGDKDGHVVLAVVLSVAVVVVVVVVGFVIYRKRKGHKQETSYESPGDKDTDFQSV